jgi:hypothetical protein
LLLLLVPTTFNIAHNFVNGGTEFVTRRTGHGVCHGSLAAAAAVLLLVVIAMAVVTNVAVATAASRG